MEMMGVMSNSNLPDLTHTAKKGAGWVMTLGVATVLLGVLAISSPFYVGIAIQYFVGAALMIGGIFQILHAIRSSMAGSTVFAIISGLLAILCGGIMFAKPLFGLGVITLFLIAYFISDGLIKIIQAWKYRPQHGWGWFCLAESSPCYWDSLYGKIGRFQARGRSVSFLAST